MVKNPVTLGIAGGLAFGPLTRQLRVISILHPERGRVLAEEPYPETLVNARGLGLFVRRNLPLPRGPLRTHFRLHWVTIGYEKLQKSCTTKKIMVNQVAQQTAGAQRSQL